MAQDSYILDLNPEASQFVPDLASVAKLDTNNPGAMLFLQGATLPIGTCVPAGVPGYKIVTEQAKIATCPMVVRLEGDEDFILLAFKNNGANFYLYGLSAQALLAWKAPEKGDESEESILRLINLNHPKLIGAVELENTETCALKDKVEELLARLPPPSCRLSWLSCARVRPCPNPNPNPNCIPLTPLAPPPDHMCRGRGPCPRPPLRSILAIKPSLVGTDPVRSRSWG